MSRRNKKNKKATGTDTFLAKKTGKKFSEELAKLDSIEGFNLVLKRLPNPDAVLRKTGKGYETLRLLLSEGQVSTCVQSRKAATLGKKWRICLESPDDDREKFYENLLKKINLTNLISDILNAPLFGFQPVEVIWGYEDGLVLPQRAEAKPQEWFFYGKDKNLRLKLKGHSDGYIIDPAERKFLIPQHNTDYLNPYGQALLSLCFWDVAFKKGGLQFWLKFLEKYAVPYFIGKYEPGASDEQKEEILATLVKMVQDAVAAIPNDSSVEIIEASGKSASAEIFKDFIEEMNKNISKNILGQTLTTEQGDTGSYALGKVHNQVREDIIESDIRLVEETLNTLLLWVHELNFNDDNPPVIELYSPKPVTQEEASIDKTAYDMGVRFKAEHFVRKYGYKAEEITVVNNTAGVSDTDKHVTFSGTAGQAWNLQSDSTSLQQSFEEFVEKFHDGELDGIIDEKLKIVAENFAACRDFEKAEEILAELYPELNSKAFEEKLTKAIFLADLLGRVK